MVTFTKIEDPSIWAGDIRNYPTFSNLPSLAALRRRRDNQKQLVYDAQYSFPDTGADFANIYTCQRFIDDTLASPFWKERSDVTQVTAEAGRGSYARAFPFYMQNRTPRIRLPKWAWNLKIVLHEMSHLLVPAPHPSHGGMYCRAYIDLVEHFWSPVAAQQLEVAFETHRVAVAKEFER